MTESIAALFSWFRTESLTEASENNLTREEDEIQLNDTPMKEREKESRSKEKRKKKEVNRVKVNCLPLPVSDNLGSTTKLSREGPT